MRILYDYTYVALWESSVWEYSYLHTRLALVGIWAELCSGEAHYRSLKFSPSLSTHLRSNNKMFVNYKQRALPSTDIPAPLTSLLCRCPPLHIWQRQQDWPPLSWTHLTQASSTLLPDTCHSVSIIMRGFLFLSSESICFLRVCTIFRAAPTTVS